MPGRELVTNFKITNEGKEAVRIGEFATAGLRFLNPDVFTTKVDYPDYLLAERGLSLSDNSPDSAGRNQRHQHHRSGRAVGYGSITSA